MRLFRILLAIGVAYLAPGCVLVQTSVTNPIPGLTTVAVAPFINLSSERAVDGRRFALTYASELQKVPGFEVIPVGVAEHAMVDAKCDLNDPDEVLKLCQLLRADAIVVGAVTECSPYYPPRIGMQVNWYSPRSWAFYPGIPIEPDRRDQLRGWDKQQLQNWRDYQKQLDEARAPETPVWRRMYQHFRRAPGIRKLYGEPIIAGRDSGDFSTVFRAQSPTRGEQVSSQFAESAPAEPMPAPANLPAASAAGRRFPSNAIVQADGRSNPFAGQVQLAAAQIEGDIRMSNASSNPYPEPVSPQPAPLLMLPPSPPIEVPPKAPASAQKSAAPAAPAWNDTDSGSLPVLPPLRPEPANVIAPTGPRPMAPVRDSAPPPLPPQPNPYNAAPPVQPWQQDPREPLMSYTRVFDGSDADVVAALRDYVELNGDLRSGGWEGYLHRSDDFIRFTSYRMILEMLAMHGGEGKHRMIFKHRKYK